MSNDTTIPDGFKRCNKCGEVKPISDYTKDKTHSDGLRSICRKCTNDAQPRKQREILPDGFRRCTRCKEVKGYGEFNKQKTSRLGIRPVCRVCTKKESVIYVANNSERTRERSKQYRLEHPEEYKASIQDWYERNRTYVSQRAREHYLKNREKYRELRKERHRTNPEQSRLESRKRRTIQRNLNYVDIPALEGLLFIIQSNECMYCLGSLIDGFHIDHILPTRLGKLLGPNHHPGHTPPNLCLACPECNFSKNRFVLEDWLTRKYPAAMDTILHRVEYHIAIMTTLYELCGEDNRKWQQILDELERGLSIEEILG